MKHVKAIAGDAFWLMFVAWFIAAAMLVIDIAKGADFPRGYEITGTVADVHDGDTFALVVRNDAGNQEEIRVRLFAIDAPEFKGVNNFTGAKWKDQPGAVQSRDTLKSLIGGNWVRCKVISKSYDRYVCTVMVGKMDISEEMVKRGAAWVEPRYNKSQALRDAQEEARMNKSGLWSLPNPIEPRLWRKGKR